MNKEIQEMLDEAEKTANNFGNTSEIMEKILAAFKKNGTEAIIATQKGNLYAAGMNLKKITKEDVENELSVSGITILGKFISVLSNAMECAGSNKTNKGRISIDDMLDGNKGMEAVLFISEAIKIAEKMIMNKEV